MTTKVDWVPPVLDPQLVANVNWRQPCASKVVGTSQLGGKPLYINIERWRSSPEPDAAVYLVQFSRLGKIMSTHQFLAKTYTPLTEWAEGWIFAEEQRWLDATTLTPPSD